MAAELANAARLEDLPEIVQRGAQVLGAESSALAVFDPDGVALRLHMTRRRASEVQEHVDHPVEGIEIERDALYRAFIVWETRARGNGAAEF